MTFSSTLSSHSLRFPFGIESILITKYISITDPTRFPIKNTQKKYISGFTKTMRHHIIGLKWIIITFKLSFTHSSLYGIHPIPNLRVINKYRVRTRNNLLATKWVSSCNRIKTINPKTT